MPFVEHLRTWWRALSRPEQAGKLVLGTEGNAGFSLALVTLVSVLYACYGAGMGMYRGWFPGVVSALKMPLLYLLTLSVCFPALYVMNCVIGPRLRPLQNMRLLLLATSTNAVALASYAPFNYFFTATTSRNGYGFLVLMHVFVFAASGILSIVVIGVLVRATAAELGRKLRVGFVFAWMGVYGFVGAQMSWVLRPWIGSWDIPYTPFRALQGSFVESVLGILR